MTQSALTPTTSATFQRTQLDDRRRQHLHRRGCHVGVGVWRGD
jgi:hypothetical protein